MKPLISIIVPVYNVEKFLKTSLKSLINQTYKNIEILVVNDGSSDKSGEICDEFAKKDSRIRVFHQKNCGQAAARNLALNHAKGEFYSFVDSDDWVETNYIQTLYELCDSFKTDISMVGLYQNKDGSQKVLCCDETRIFSQKEVFDKICFSEDGFGCFFPKMLLKSEFMIKFPQNQPYEDIAIYHKVISKAEFIALSKEPKYHYRIHQNSTTNSNFNPKQLFHIKNATKFRNFIIKKYPDLKPCANYFLCNAMAMQNNERILQQAKEEIEIKPDPRVPYGKGKTTSNPEAFKF